MNARDNAPLRAQIADRLAARTLSTEQAAAALHIKPRTLRDKDKARDAALSSIRAGAQRAEVFALVPIGHARRGAEWRSA